MFDAGDALVVGNHRVSEMLGMSSGEVPPGIKIGDLGQLQVATSDLSLADGKAILRTILKLKSLGKRTTHVLDLADGRTLSINFASMEDGGWLVTLEDISERRLVETKIAHMAHHDALTGLANRVLFSDRLDEMVVRSANGTPFAVMYLDLDHFKAVNDTLGHPIGDALLRAVTERLQRTVRDNDTVARLGGDEFAIVSPIFNSRMTA